MQKRWRDSNGESCTPIFCSATVCVFPGRESEELIRDGQVARSMHARRDLSECTAATDGSAAVD